MRRICKDLMIVPDSLLVEEGRLTHLRRRKLIETGHYIHEDEFDSRYKMPDIMKKLKGLYYSKCAYCESKVEQGHVEHYRPKDKYYWLAYSWDNLLYSCPTCNQYKGTNFDISGESIEPPTLSDDLSEINVWSSRIYDDHEKPMFLNPERDDLDNVFLFDRQGHVKGNNSVRADYTIEQCHLDRDFLVDERRKIVDDFKNEATAEYLKAATKDDQKQTISFLVRNFLRKSEDDTNTYTAYRKSAMSWLDDIIKEIFRQ